MPDSHERYKPLEGNGTKVDLAVLKSEIVHGFETIDRRLEGIDTEVAEHGSQISDCKTEIAVLKATALRIDAIRLSALVGAVVLIVGVAGKIAGVF